MKKKRISIELDSVWVLEQRGADALPMDKCIDAMKTAFPEDFNVLSVGLVGCKAEISVPDEQAADIGARLAALLKKTFGVSDIFSIATLTVDDVSAAKPKAEPAVPLSEPAKTKRSAAQDDAAQKADGEDAVNGILNRIDALFGCQEFKALAHELAGIAPQVKKYKTKNTFLFQNYLFSINDGYGLTTYLELFAELIEKLGLFSFTNSNRVVELTVPPKGREGGAAVFKEVLTGIDPFNKGGKLVCIDISEWMNQTKDASFRKFLFALEDMEDRYIFVFRVPFIESDVFEGINRYLSDVLFMRKVLFMPLEHEDLIKYAHQKFGELGYSMREDAWDVFSARVAEEKSDGRFYGINTINKIVNETVYRKQLSNVGRDADDTDIAREDILSLADSYDGSSMSGEDALNALVGMKALKAKIMDAVAQIEIALKNKGLEKPCIHMRFVGNPGTGKTTVARILGKILKERGILRNGSFFEYSGRDFCGMYIGETAPKTASICRDAYGSVLFIDEAYSLYTGDDNSRDYGREALTTLISEMENHRSDLMVIMACYRDDMDMLMKGNAGLLSRMPYTIDFPNYTRDELYAIFVSMAGRSFKLEDGLLDEAKAYFDRIPDELIKSKEFSNARFVRNLFERTWGKAAIRMRLTNDDKLELKAEDFTKATAENEFDVFNQKKRAVIGFN